MYMWCPEKIEWKSSDENEGEYQESCSNGININEI